MSFISSAAHRKFILQCQHLLTNAREQDLLPETDEKTARIKADLNELQQLIEAYLNTRSLLPELVHDYNVLHRRIRVNVRRMRACRPTLKKK